MGVVVMGTWTFWPAGDPKPVEPEPSQAPPVPIEFDRKVDSPEYKARVEAWDKYIQEQTEGEQERYQESCKLCFPPKCVKYLWARNGPEDPKTINNLSDFWWDCNEKSIEPFGEDAFEKKWSSEEIQKRSDVLEKAFEKFSK